MCSSKTSASSLIGSISKIPPPSLSISTIVSGSS
jgi:hypothetical protein